jgi:hypothetical protein
MGSQQRFRQTELARAIRAVTRAGAEPERVEIAADGSIRLILREQQEAPSTT